MIQFGFLDTNSDGRLLRSEIVYGSWDPHSRTERWRTRHCLRLCLPVSRVLLDLIASLDIVNKILHLKLKITRICAVLKSQ